MMGRHARSESPFYYRIEDQIRENHLLRLIDEHVDFGFVHERMKDSYVNTGRPSIDPAGMVLSLSLNRLIARWIESGTRDPIVIIAVSLVLIAVATLACLIPARRALAIDPIAALRCE